MVMTGELVGNGSSVPSLSKSYAKIPHVLDIPHMIRIQLDSYHWFQDEGLQELLAEISPIQDFTGKRMELRFAREINPGDPLEKPEDYVGLVPLVDVKIERRTLAHTGEAITLDAAQELRKAKVA